MRVSNANGTLAWLLVALILSVSTAQAKAAGSSLPRGYKKWGLATELEVPVFDSFRGDGRIIGYVRRGARIPVRGASKPKPCTHEGLPGEWLKTPGGYVCSSYGVVIGGRPSQLSPRQRVVSRAKALPFDYVKVTRVGTPRYVRPSQSARDEIERQTKAFFLAKDKIFRRKGRRWLRTVYGEHVRLKDTKKVEPPDFRGVTLGAHRRLPVAFIIGPEEGITARCRRQRQLVGCGRATKHTRFEPDGFVTVGTREYVRSRRGQYYPVEYVRIAEQITRPDSIPDDARWVHINLDEQTFVAYVGNVPQYVSLVSTGVEGRDTPEGLFRTQRKYVTKTMRGPDETHGRYRVEEIPWIMYYHGAYAVHGAYWHSQFGEVRSHGCTNLAPADAKWLFEFDQASIPKGWHANVDASGGLYFYFSRFEEDDPFEDEERDES